MPILQWLTRDEDIRAAKSVPYRLLEELSDLSCGDLDTGNMLIQGDNLEALKAVCGEFQFCLIISCEFQVLSYRY